jgi:ribosomal protein L12E/L44/L45/RPP1/RPP2
MCQKSCKTITRPTIYSAICYRPSYFNRDTGDQQSDDHIVQCFDDLDELMAFVAPLLRENIFGENLSDWDITVLINGVDWALYQSMDLATKALYGPNMEEVVEKMKSVETAFYAEKAENDKKEQARLARANTKASNRQETKDKALLKTLIAKYGAPT